MATRTRLRAVPRVDETTFMRLLMFALSRLQQVRVHRQNSGGVLVRDERGRPLRRFDAGPPNGAADLSGWVRPEGWRLEIEVKAEDGERSSEQIAWGGRVAADGCVYVCVTYDAAFALDDNVALAVADVVNAIAARRERSTTAARCSGTPGAASWGRCDKARGHDPPCSHDPSSHQGVA